MGREGGKLGLSAVQNPRLMSFEHLGPLAGADTLIERDEEEGFRRREKRYKWYSVVDGRWGYLVYTYILWGE